MQLLRALPALSLLAATAHAAITINLSSGPPIQMVQGIGGIQATISATGGVAPPGGSVCYTWTVTGFNIPGVGAFPSSCGPQAVLSGTPTTPGTYSFSVSVIDGQGGSASLSISAIVNPPLTIVTQTLPDIQSGVPYSAQVVVQGGLTPYQQFQCNVGHFSLSCNQGLVTGTINASADSTILCGVDVRVTDRTGTVVQRCFDLRIKAAQPPSNVLTITTSALPAATVGQPYSFQATAINVTGPPKWSAIGLPAGLSISLSGLISGTPTGPAGTFQVILGVGDNTALTATRSISMAVQAAQPPSNNLTITTTSLPAATVGQPYSFQAAAANVTGPPKWSATGLPAGLTISQSGLISGTPTGPAGTFQVTLGLGDNTPNTATRTIPMTVQAASNPNPDPNPGPGDPRAKVTLTTPILLDPLVLGKFITFKFAATNGVPPYKFFAAILTLPTGMTLNSDGTYIGAPTKTGDYSFQVMVTDSKGDTDTKTYTQTVFDAPRITNTFPRGEVGKPYNVLVEITGGALPYRVEASNLPPGLTFSSQTRRVTGNPSPAGTYESLFVITDGNDTKVTEKVSITIDPPPGPLQITSTSPLPAMSFAALASYTFTATGGRPPYTWSIVGNSIPGLQLNSSTGTLSGLPGLTGTQGLIVRVTDSEARTDQKPFEVLILPPAQLSLSPSALSLTLLANNNIPSTDFVKLLNANGTETIEVIGVGGAPVAVSASLLPDGTIPLTTTTPPNAPTSFRNILRITGAPGQTLELPIDITVLQPPPQTSFLLINGKPLDEHPPILYSTKRNESTRVDIEFTVPSGAPFNYEINLRSPETPSNNLVQSESIALLDPRSGRRLVSALIHPDVPPGVYKGEIRFSLTGRPDLPPTVIPIGIIVEEPSAVSTTSFLAGSRRKLGSNAQLDTQLHTVCLAPGSQLVVFTPALQTPAPEPDCQLVESPASTQPVVKIVTATTAQPDQVKIIQLPGNDDLSQPAIEADDQFITPGENPALEITNPGSSPINVSPNRAPKNRPFPPLIIPGRTTAKVLWENLFPDSLGEGSYLDILAEPAPSPSTPPGSNKPFSVIQFAAVDGIPAPSAKSEKFADACTPSRLHVLSRMPTPISAKIGSPEWLRVTVYDNCGTPRTDARLTVWPGNGDPSVRLAHTLRGRYNGFWTPIRTAAGTYPLIVSALAGTLSGLANYPVTIAPDPAATLLESASVVSGASFEGGRVRAPGEFVSLFGANLASQTVAATSVPLPTTLGGVRVELNGVPLPLLFVSATQINAILPSTVPANTILQLALYKGTAPPVLIDLPVSAAQPAVFSRDLTGKGQGIILDAQFRFYDSANPARPGDPFVIYLSGLGEVDPPVPTGAAAPTTSLHRAKAAVKVTIGGVEVKNLLFAGLAPGLVGVYQINGVVPEGVSPGNAVPVTVTAAGQTSPAVTIAVR